jgi:glycosyltransferase involved in cell wall biosynthesis
LRTLQHDRYTIAIAHDYLTTMGGAERVVLSMARTFPDAPLFTSLFEPLAVLPELADGLDVRPSPLNRVKLFRRNHRAAMPFLSATFKRIEIDADVVLCSTSGWAHGVTTTGRKIAYCYNPARWIYQRREYAPPRKPFWWATALAIHPYLLHRDREAAASCQRYIAISTIVAERVQRAYGRDAEVLPPPTTFDPSGPQRAIPGLDSGFLMSVGRLVAHKNTDDLVRAFADLSDLQLVIVGDGPEYQRLASSIPSNVVMVGEVGDDRLRWLYANCAGLVSASREDYGLTPLEAASFGKPSVLLRFGGFLDTMVEEETALFFEEADSASIAATIRRAAKQEWNETTIRENAQRFSLPRFEDRLRTIVSEELALV